ncbi:hypothetical protein PHISCL_06814 [Aspergillus sclerotialis]|uniref:Uncharacterized protein n=1 Tax=Aspergillus sclerotialis TaxID=2070753 RepID=A0A3A2ZS92_9EURO|nr:hypothetical protein PHISCL_06814 [Aspergillus sclerotialis]
MQLGLSETLSSLVSRRFATAKDAGHLTFSATHLSIIHSSGLPFQLRYCPALSKKPTGAPKPDGHAPAPKPDPFKDPSPDLLLTQFPPDNPSYTLVLNKFPVIHNHFILATKEWKPQDHVLEKGDLEAAFACVRAWGGDGEKRLFAFFNSGSESGASQPHRHLQFLPVEDMRHDGEGFGDWEPLIDRLAADGQDGGDGLRRLSQLSFAHFALPIPSNADADVLYRMYLALYRAAVKAAQGTKETANEEPAVDGEAAISYNLALTESTMMICPRRNESAEIRVAAEETDDNSDSGVVALNGTILAGTLMVKAEAEWNELRRNQENLTRVLSTIGFPQPDSRGVSSL